MARGHTVHSAPQKRGAMLSRRLVRAGVVRLRVAAVRNDTLKIKLKLIQFLRNTTGYGPRLVPTNESRFESRGVESILILKSRPFTIVSRDIESPSLINEFVQDGCSPSDSTRLGTRWCVTSLRDRDPWNTNLFLWGRSLITGYGPYGYGVFRWGLKLKYTRIADFTFSWISLLVTLLQSELITGWSMKPKLVISTEHMTIQPPFILTGWGLLDKDRSCEVALDRASEKILTNIFIYREGIIGSHRAVNQPATATTSGRTWQTKRSWAGCHDLAKYNEQVALRFPAGAEDTEKQSTVKKSSHLTESSKTTTTTTTTTSSQHTFRPVNLVNIPLPTTGGHVTAYSIELFRSRPVAGMSS
uniref:Uncharacterized protein n=1 Tax=Timema douglasi TaxID=61478 RepID=A0A7R8VGH3_TIMDO|nr:unnamed protein product [Timema douglasi]